MPAWKKSTLIVALSVSVLLAPSTSPTKTFSKETSALQSGVDKVAELRSEADVKKAVAYTDAEIQQAEAASSPEADAARHQANIVEIRREIANAKDPQVRKALQEEYNNLQGPTADSGDLMDFKVYGKDQANA